jgi:twitching motility two-component system response regulator PilG
VNEGIRLAKADNRSRARWLLMEASALNPNSELVWLSLAAVVEKPADAVRCLQKVLKINPNNEQAITCLNQIYAKVGSPEPAWQCPICLSSFQMEMNNCPHCHSLLTLTDLDALLDNRAADRTALQEALKRYSEAVQRDEDPGAYYHLALAFLNNGQIAEGTNALRRASQMQPEDQGLKNLIVALQQRQTQTYAADAKTILVIDDSPTVCKLVSLSLEQHGHRVLVASEMMEALAKLNESKLDLILLDIMLPGADGYQVCKIIKGYASTKSVPVVMLSGRDGFFDKMRARLVGAQGYITKPFVPNDLLKAVEKHCKKSK